MQTDNSYGKVFKALRANGMLENTLIICSSDNGTSPYASKQSELEKMGHFPSGDLRGSKADIWDGGHRVPFIVHWPKIVKPDTRSDKLTCLGDVMATTAEIVGYKLPENAGEDSISFLPVLKGVKKYARKTVIHHSIPGYFAIRQENYKLIMCPGSGGWTKPRTNDRLWKKLEKQEKPTVQLYDMSKDIGEQKNLAAQMPEKVKELKKLLEKQVEDGRTTPGSKQKNDTEIDIEKRPKKQK